MSRRMLYLMLGMCLAVLWLAACGGGAAQPTAAPTSAPAAATAPTTAAPTTAAPTVAAPTAAPTATAVPPTAVPTEAPAQPAEMSGTQIDMNNPLFKAYYAVFNKFPRQMHAEVFDATKNTTTTVTIQTDAKDHAQYDIEGGDGNLTSMIIISPTMYIKYAGTWQKVPGAQANMMLTMITSADYLEQVLNAFGKLASYSVKPLGPEDLNGVSTTAFSAEFTTKDGKTSTSKAWLGADGLLVQDNIQTSDGTVVTTTFSYDPGIKVEAPLP